MLINPSGINKYYYRFLCAEKDPFWEPADCKVLIGSVHVFLQSIAYLIDMDENLAITNFKVDGTCLVRQITVA